MSHGFAKPSAIPGYTYGGTVTFTESGSFEKADYPGLRAVKIGRDPLTLVVDLPDSVAITPAPPDSDGPRGIIDYVRVSSNQTISNTTETDVTGMTLTVPTPGNRLIRVTAEAQVLKQTDVGRVTGRIYRGTTRVGRVGQWNQMELTTAAQWRGFGMVVEAPTAGTHIYKVTVECDPAGVRVDGTDEVPAWMVAEDIGPAAPFVEVHLYYGASSSLLKGIGIDHSQYPLGVLGYAQFTNAQAPITSEVDLTNMSVTVNIPAGRRIRITGHCYWASTSETGMLVETRIKEGSTELHLNQITIGEANRVYYARPEMVLTPSAGSHTYKLTGQRSVGTDSITFIGNANRTSFIIVEDLGPA